jgi:TatD DNase family protein
MKAIDCHCHLSHTQKKGLKLVEILEHAEESNVIAMVDSPVYPKDYQQTIKRHKSYPNRIFATLGAPPANYHEMDIDKIVNLISQFAEEKAIVGIGEVGLDYYWVKDEKIRDLQHKTFARFIDLANELQLPLIIHSRDAEQQAIELLKRAETTVIMHSFAGNVELAHECIERDYFISIPTAVTNRKKHRRLARKVPLNRLLTETDSPYLSPFPEKRRNEPAFVVEAVKEIAKLKEEALEEVAAILLKNAKTAFQLSL